MACLWATGLGVLLWGCPRREEGHPSSTVPQASAGPELRLEKLTLIPPAEKVIRAETPQKFRLESSPPLPPDREVTWTFTAASSVFTQPGRGASVEVTFPSAGIYTAQARTGTAASTLAELRVYQIGLVGSDGRPLREARIARLSRDAFDAEGRLRAPIVLSHPDRFQVVVEDPGPNPPGSVAVSIRPGDPPLSLALVGPGERRLTRALLLLGDEEDALAAIGSGLLASPGDRMEFQYREEPAGGIRVGPSVIHEIPVNFVLVGGGLPPAREVEEAIPLRLAAANKVWAPLGRRFTLGKVTRLEAVRGLFLVRGRAAGVEGGGRPSRLGVLVDGREVSVPGAWKRDGGAMTPKSTARALAERMEPSYHVELLEDLLAGDRQAVVVEVRRRDGSPARVERLSEGEDLSQAVAPLEANAWDRDLEVTSAPETLTIDELGILAVGRQKTSPGMEVFLLPGLHSPEGRPAFKIYPAFRFPRKIAGSVAIAWPLMDQSGRFPYGLARALGELLLPAGLRPSPEDTLFADPLSESAGTGAHKRVTETTALRIAERGRELSSQK